MWVRGETAEGWPQFAGLFGSLQEKVPCQHTLPISSYFRIRGLRQDEAARGQRSEDGVVLGEFHARNGGSAIRNPSFQPFKAPVPFLLMRPAVVSDWMFFLDNEDWLSSWARGFGESAVPALAEKLRRTN